MVTPNPQIERMVITQTLNAPKKFKNYLITNKVTTKLLNSLGTSIFRTLTHHSIWGLGVRHLLITLALLFSTISQAQITVQVDRTDIASSESFKLIFVSDGAVDDDPDFSPLDVFFQIINQSKSSNVSIINGTVSRKQTWTLTLFAKQLGKITIPAIAFGTDKSPPAIITISKKNRPSATGSNKDIFIKTEVSEQDVVIGQQILLKVKIFTRLNISSAQLSNPITTGFESVHAQLGQSTQYSTIVNNINYTVLQQNYVITANTSGAGTIEPIILTAETGKSSNRFFDPFGQSKIIKIISEAIKINVAPKPTTAHQLWIPASNVQIKSQISNGPYKSGEPINLTLIIEAEQQVAELLPILPLEKQDAFKIYTDKPVFTNTPNAKGINGKLIQKFAIIPQQEGELILPQYQVQWWNTKTKQFEIAKAPSRTLIIAASNAPVINFNNDRQVKTTNTVQNNANNANNQQIWIWQIVSLCLLIMWLITLRLYLKSKKVAVKVIKSAQPNANKAKQKLIKACLNSNAKQAQLELVAWAKIIYSNDNIVNIKQIKPQVSDNFQIEIDALQQALYSEKQFDWHGFKLAELIKKHKGKKETDSNGVQLKNLYPG